MRKIVALSALVACTAFSSGQTPAAQPASPAKPEPAGGQAQPQQPTPRDPRHLLIWSDEFDGAVGSAPDPACWTYDLGAGGWGNGELETYTNRPENASIVADPAATDGRALAITAIRKGDGAYTSARLKTQGKMSLTYGRWEARAKLPHGKGIWPAIWMLGSNVGDAGWPACGEIDIMENVGGTHVHGTIHGPGYSAGSARSSAYALPNGARFSDDYHVFAVSWSPTAIRFYVDDTLYGVRTRSSIPAGAKWVFDHPFFAIVNLAVGGHWPGYPDDTTVFPQRLLVDYVRVYTESPTYSDLPGGWSAQDIGTPAKAGRAGIDPSLGMWNLTSTGADLWGPADQFLFASREVTGDMSISTLVTGLENTNEWAKAGVMFRSSADADAPNVAVVATRSRGIRFQWRAAAGAATSDAEVAEIATPVWVRLDRSGERFSGYYSRDGKAWVQVGTAQTVDLPGTALAGLAATSHNGSAANTSTFTNVSVVPIGWGSEDIGRPTLPGSAVFDAKSKAWVIAASGADIWGTSDECSFAGRDLVGDGEIVARLGSMENTDTWAKAGLMFRDGSAADAAFAMVAQLPSGELSFQWRTAAGQAADWVGATAGGATAGKWIRLVRRGGSVAAYYAMTTAAPADSDWVQLGAAQAIPMAATIRAGLAVASHNNSALCNARFTDVSLAGLGGAAAKQ